MPDRALYYPYIELPRSPALNRVLLYWDSVGAFVPREYRPRRYLRDLIASGLVEPIDPLRIRHEPEFFAGLETLLDAVQSAAWPAAAPVLLHIGKADMRVWAELRERRLAADFAEGRDWVPVNAHAGFAYLAFLALSHCRADANREPVTDQQDLFETGVWPTPIEALTESTEIRGVLLRDVLPAPRQPVPIEEILTFKTQHAAGLRRFRREVESLLIRCLSESEPDLRARIVDEAHAGLQDAATELRRRMEERNWPTAPGMICAALAGSPAVASAFVTGKPGLAATGLIPLLAEVIRTSWHTPVESDEPVLYAALAQRTFDGRHHALD